MSLAELLCLRKKLSKGKMNLTGQKGNKMQQKIKMIGMDLDGTLLNERKELTPYSRKVLEKAVSQGVTVLVATGRPISGVPEELRNFQGMRYALTANGARILDLKEDKVLYESLVSTKSAEKILGVFEQYDTLREVYFDGISYVQQEAMAELEKYVANPSMREYIRATKRTAKDVREKVREMNRGLDKVHAMFQHPKERMAAWEDLKKIPDITISSALENNIEINGKDVNKGKGLLKLGELLGIRREEIMACGDGMNDLAMLQEAGFAVAMENGVAEVKDAADYITVSNEEDGVAKAIEKFVLA